MQEEVERLSREAVRLRGQLRSATEANAALTSRVQKTEGELLRLGRVVEQIVRQLAIPAPDGDARANDIRNMVRDVIERG